MSRQQETLFDYKADNMKIIVCKYRLTSLRVCLIHPSCSLKEQYLSPSMTGVLVSSRLVSKYHMCINHNWKKCYTYANIRG